MKKNFNLYFMALVAAIGGLLSGFDTGVISGALLYINQDWNLSSSAQGFLVSAVLLGAFLGALLNGRVVDIFGRKKMIILSSVIFFVGSVLCAISKDFNMLYFSRLFVGLGVGIVTFVCPLYISEISPKENRGALVCLFQLAITAGILFSYSVNFLCANFTHSWRLMLLFGIAPSLILFFGILNSPDTPRFLILKGKIDEARKVLAKINDENAENTISEISNSLQTKSEKIQFKKYLIMPFVVGVGIMFVQIATGINTIIYYAPTIFKNAGFEGNLGAILATGIIGVVNFLMTFPAIKYSDKIGRKPLLFMGLSGILVSMTLISLTFQFQVQLGEISKWLCVINAIVFVVSFSFSLGPIALTLVSEIFPLNIRGFAMSIAVVANFVFNFIVTSAFPVLIDKIKEAQTFLIFALVALFSIFFVYFFVPETKGKSLETIEDNWKKGILPKDF